MKDPNDFQGFDYSAIWGEHPGVYIIVYEHGVHIKIMNYELDNIRNIKSGKSNDIL